MSGLAHQRGRQNQLVAELQQVASGLARADAIGILQAANWDVQLAADLFYSGSWPAAGATAQPEPAVDATKIEAWFERYHDSEVPDTMQIEGIAKFCEDLQVSPEDPVLLVISKHFGAENMMVFTKAEFVAGMKSIQVDSLEDLSAALPRLRAQLEDPASFKEVYNFTFKWACPPGQKSMPVETAVAFWQLLLPGSFALLPEWCAYVEANRKHAISRDEWQLLLDFARTVDKDLNGYDENAAWPVVIDTFVEHLQAQKAAA